MIKNVIDAMAYTKLVCNAQNAVDDMFLSFFACTDFSFMQYW